METIEGREPPREPMVGALDCLLVVDKSRLQRARHMGTGTLVGTVVVCNEWATVMLNRPCTAQRLCLGRTVPNDGYQLCSPLCLPALGRVASSMYTVSFDLRCPYSCTPSVAQEKGLSARTVLCAAQRVPLGRRHHYRIVGRPSLARIHLHNA